MTWSTAPGCGAWPNEAGEVTRTDRILLTLPRNWAVGWDCSIAALEMGALSMAASAPTLDDVLEYAPTA